MKNRVYVFLLLSASSLVSYPQPQQSWYQRFTNWLTAKSETQRFREASTSFLKALPEQEFEHLEELGYSSVPTIQTQIERVKNRQDSLVTKLRDYQYTYPGKHVNYVTAVRADFLPQSTELAKLGYEMKFLDPKRKDDFLNKLAAARDTLKETLSKEAPDYMREDNRVFYRKVAQGETPIDDNMSSLGREILLRTDSWLRGADMLSILDTMIWQVNTDVQRQKTVPAVQEIAVAPHIGQLRLTPEQVKAALQKPRDIFKEKPVYVNRPEQK